MPEALLEAEQGAIEHMNADHRDAMNLYATRLLGAEACGLALHRLRSRWHRHAGRSEQRCGWISRNG